MAVSQFEMQLCFVYGTLKRGQPNHRYMLDGDTGRAEFVCSGHTARKYPLVISGQYNIPLLVYAEGQGQIVHGEVYRVDGKKRDFLDDFESHPTLYERTMVDICVPDKTATGETTAAETAMGKTTVAETTTGETTTTGDKTETRIIKCWAYFLKNYKPEMLQLETYSCYDSYGSHGMPYVDTVREIILTRHRSEKDGSLEEMLVPVPVISQP